VGAVSDASKDSLIVPVLQLRDAPRCRFAVRGSYHLYDAARYHTWVLPKAPASVIGIDSAAWNGRIVKGIEAYRQSTLTQREYA
jgi:hypothetical protein